MPFRFSNLENVKTTELIEAFNSAFANYFVKIELNEESFSQKVVTENILLKKSLGAFVDDRLVGFILVGLDELAGQGIGYNGGTGVLPAFRGKQLTSQMYGIVLAQLKAEGISFQQLEVIVENQAAIRVYEKLGFRKSRTLSCFKGKLLATNIREDLELKALCDLDEQLFPQFWNSSPSWQNSLSAIKRMNPRPQVLGAFQKGQLLGYVIYTNQGRIKQFAVKEAFRHLGVAQTLFSCISLELSGADVFVINLDKDDTESVSFLQKIGLHVFLEQIEMTLNVP